MIDLRVNASAPKMKVGRRPLAVSVPQIEESLMEAISTRFKRHGKWSRDTICQVYRALVRNS